MTAETDLGDCAIDLKTPIYEFETNFDADVEWDSDGDWDCEVAKPVSSGETKVVSPPSVPSLVSTSRADTGSSPEEKYIPL